MASHIDVAERIENGIGADGRLHVEVHYLGSSLPRYLTQPIDEAAQHAGELVPCVVLNQKGHTVDGALVLMNVGDLERLLSPALGAVGDAVARARNGDAEAADWLATMRPDEVG